MRPDLVVLIVAGWSGCTTLAVALCVAAKRGDEALRLASASQPALIPASDYAVQMREQSASRFVRHTFAV
jgi:hypothetical protein